MGSAYPSKAMGEADTACQPPCSMGTVPWPEAPLAIAPHSGKTEALRPACASWMPAAAPCEWMKSTTRDHAVACASV